MQKIYTVVIGVNGLIGNSLTRAFEGHRSYFYTHGNINSGGFSSQVANFDAPFVLLYNAGYGNQKHQQERKEMFGANIELPEELFLRCVRNKNFLGFIYTGSSSMYGRVDHPMKESDPFCPVTLYAKTKTIGHIRLHELGKRYGKKVVTVLPFSVYGSREDPSRLFQTLRRVFYKGEIQIGPHYFVRVSRGNHDWIHVDDYARVVKYVVDNFDRAPNILNIGTGIMTDNHDVVYIFDKLFGKTKQVELTEDRSKTDSPMWVADTTLLKSFYPGITIRPLEDGIRHWYVPIKEQAGWYNYATATIGSSATWQTTYGGAAGGRISSGVFPGASDTTDIT